jgi:2-keto-4-pentenoate hydratase/2-oxohepta-3-ene-1,7-dioic acid hydratase in catechol pathway
MRLVRFGLQGKIGYGIHIEDGIQPIAWEPYEDFEESYHKLAHADVALLAPVVPTKIIGIGLNYRDHAEEFGMEVPEEPTIFLKAPSTLLDPDGTIIYPDSAGQVDYEAELAVVIGRQARHVDAGDALSFVFGYTCGMDITARDLQIADGQWTRAKNFDTFCPLGPWVETELDPGNLDITLNHNGELKQSSNTSLLIFGVPRLIEFLSGIMTLYPGDVIMTGTPSGVGPVERGDTLEMAIEGIGTLGCTVA